MLSLFSQLHLLRSGGWDNDTLSWGKAVSCFLTFATVFYITASRGNTETMAVPDLQERRQICQKMSLKSNKVFVKNLTFPLLYINPQLYKAEDLRQR